MFPKAKFVHIYRNPYVVYASMRNFYRKTIEGFMLRNAKEKEIENNILGVYKQMMISYYKEKSLIPDGNLIELKFEDFENDIINQLNSIYSGLEIDGFERAKLKFSSYINSLKNYKKNTYLISQNAIDKIKQHWSFTIKKWHYDIPIELQVF